MQIRLVCLVSFLLGVDVACGNTVYCNLAKHIAVSEINSVPQFPLDFKVVQKLYIVRTS